MQALHPQRLDFLDSVRGLAALSVVYSHYVNGFGLPYGTERFFVDTPLHFWWDGFAAVSLFFVLSGFVLSLRFFGSARQPFVQFSYRDYLIARVFRIWVPYFVVFVVSLLIWRFFKRSWGTLPEQTAWFQGLWSDWRGSRNFLREAMLVLGGGYWVIPQAWTLSLELVISLFVPFGAAIGSFHLIALFLPVVAGILFLKLPMYLFHFALGILLAKIYRERRDGFEEFVSRGFWPILCAGIVLYTYRFSVAPYYPSFIAESGIWYATGLGSLAILACVLSNERLQAFLRRPALRFLGRISYSVYLCHFAIVIAFAPAFIRFVNRVGIADKSVAWLLGSFAVTALTLVASAALERWVEAPSIGLGKKLCSLLPAWPIPGPLSFFR